MKILKAIDFAVKKHSGQIRRESKLMYVTHPIVVSQLITKYKGDSKNLEELQIAALLHDVVEDTNTSFVEIEREFGSMVAAIVIELTSDKKRIKKIGKNEYLKEKMVNMSNYAFILKLIDRLSNILDNPSDNYIKDTLSLMNFLRDNRKSINKRQIDIVEEIISECKKLIKKDK